MLPETVSAAVSAFTLIALAEIGDMTQIAVAGLAGSLSPMAVWVGATLALVLVSALGIWARLGQTLARCGYPSFNTACITQLVGRPCPFCFSVTHSRSFAQFVYFF